MTVGGLISLLSRYDRDQEIVVRTENSDYAQDFTRNVREYGLSAFYGDDYNVLAIRTERVGALTDPFDEEDY